MAAHVKTEIAMWATGASMTYPVIIDGPYYVFYATATTTNHVAIGDLIVITANKVDEIEYCADNGHVVGIVLDSAHNIAELLKNQTRGTAPTKDLYFNDTSIIEVAIPLPGTIVSCKVSATVALEVGSNVMAGTTGALAVADDSSPAFGLSLVYNTSGTGTDYVAVLWGSTTLLTKT